MDSSPPPGSREKWNIVHLAGNAGALSGSDPVGVLRHHELLDKVDAGMVVLDIGVGLGNMARYLHGRDVTVDCLDVSDAAEQTVRPFIRSFYLAERIENLPGCEYDLAISHIVTQHMGEDDLRRQVREVFRSLRPGGLFSLHAAGHARLEMNNWPGPVRVGYDGSMCRTPEYLMAIVEQETGALRRLTLLDKRMDWPQFETYWYWLWIAKSPPEE